MKVIFEIQPCPAAAEPGWVVRPPLPTTRAMCPGHCDRATVTLRRPGTAVGAGATTAAGAAAGRGGVTGCEALVRSTSVNTIAAIDGTTTRPMIPLAELLSLAIY